MNHLYRIFEATNINNFLLPYSRFIRRVDQLTAGPFYAKTEALYHNEVSIFRRFTNQTIREVGRLPSNISSLSFHPRENAYYLYGSYYGIGGISSTLADNTFEAITQKNSTHYTITINENRLHRTFNYEQKSRFLNFLEVKRDITSCENLRFEIPHIIDNAFDLLKNQHSEHFETELYENVSNEIMSILLELIEMARFNNLRVNSNAYLLDRAIAAINSYNIPHISMLELSNKLHTHRRNIETAFRNYINLSPKDYINNLRLNHIRFSLLQSAKSKNHVSTVARDFGVKHMGNFSKAYYCLFGERPKETLSRAPIKVSHT